MKKLISLMCFLFASFYIYSQSDSTISIGIHSGITYSNISTKNNKPLQYNYTTGYITGLSFKLNFKPRIYIETNIDLYQNGFGSYAKNSLKTDSFTGVKSYYEYNQTDKQNYLNNSWLIGYNYGKNLKIDCEIGLYWAYFIQSYYKANDYVYVDSSEAKYFQIPSGPITFSDTYDNKLFTSIDFGILAGVGFCYKLNSQFEILIHSRYYHGLVDISKQSYNAPIETYNKSFNILLGIRMKI